MTSSQNQDRPRRIIAEFGQNSPDFLVAKETSESTSAEAKAEAGPSADNARFFIDDADTIGGTLAVAELQDIDRDSGEAGMTLRVAGVGEDDLAYRLTVTDMRGALGAMLHEAGVEKAYFVDTNLTPDTLARIGSHATEQAAVEFTLPEHEPIRQPLAMAA